MSPYLSYEEYQQFYLPFVLRNKEYISDIYTTIRIAPFMHDAMGGELNVDELIAKALKVQKDTGIEISATFNNITIDPKFENFELFIKNFTPLYNMGIKSMTMPIYHWMATKELKRVFPQIKIKNTILSEVSNAREFWDAAMVGYDVVNIDRNLLRDFHTLKEIKKAQTIFAERHGKYVKTQILPNEQCIGHCPTRREHYATNFSGKHYFGEALSEVTCRDWEKKDLHYAYKKAVASPFREDILELLEYVDIFKMFGRDGKTMLKHSFAVMESFIQKEPIVPTFPNAMKLADKDFSKFERWRNAIKNCKFQCFDCDICNSLEPL
ncbi:MAG: hypothetical protein FP820_09845 [Sulfurimonas sp.]|nr:hypothetical protein [Sulfurimonas sp.]MBU1216063.1 hypothetical protein [bacterium]MBU1434369.1 hypothetical protein [bacterium]MBU1501947.1 hypothetical protein [bacterium]MBU3939578.1 hypothetical protein [bacterium]